MSLVVLGHRHQQAREKNEVDGEAHDRPRNLGVRLLKSHLGAASFDIFLLVDGRLQRRTVYLPHGVNWHSGQKKLRTLNTMTRVSRIDFGPNCDGIASVQITMPVTGKSDPHGKSVFEAVNTISKTTKPRTFD